MKAKQLSIVLAALVSALVLSVVVYSHSKVSKCEDAYTTAAKSVEGVVSAEFECSFQFGGGWQRAKVTVKATTKTEATAVMDGVLRALAASPGLEDTWATPQQYTNEDGTVAVAANSVGFKAPPTVGDLRTHYGIKPG